jgi:hypothetical protein
MKTRRLTGDIGIVKSVEGSSTGEESRLGLYLDLVRGRGAEECSDRSDKDGEQDARDYFLHGFADSSFLLVNFANN